MSHRQTEATQAHTCNEGCPRAKPVTAWARDTMAFDPGARVRDVEYGGKRYRITNVMGPGWYMSIKAWDNTYNPDGYWQHIGMARWEDWCGVARVIAARR